MLYLKLDGRNIHITTDMNYMKLGYGHRTEIVLNDEVLRAIIPDYMEEFKNKIQSVVVFVPHCFSLASGDLGYYSSLFTDYCSKQQMVWAIEGRDWIEC